MQERIPIDSMLKQANWHHNNLPMSRRSIPDMHSSPAETLKALGQYDLQTDDYRPGPSIRREIEAAEQLTLELALSSDIFAPHPIQRPRVVDETLDEALETMSIAAGAMSLNVPEPPDVQFGFLRPSLSRGVGHYGRQSEDKLDKHRLCPLGVRLLLRDWEVGSDPEGYAYEDPYDSTAVTAPPVAHRIPAAGGNIKTGMPPSCAPPTLAQAAQIPHSIAFSRPPNISHTQPSHFGITTGDHRVAPLGSQPAALDVPAYLSQETSLMPSTQVLPGPFGGRLTGAKKKTAKKRVGGF